jgi:predicted Zn-dependent protease
MHGRRRLVSDDASSVGLKSAIATLIRRRRAAFANISPPGPLQYPLLVTISLVMAFGIAAWTARMRPSLFPYATLAEQMPDDARAAVGRLAMTEITRDGGRCNGVAGASVLNRLVGRLQRAAGTELQFRANVVDEPAINVFTMMDHRIVLTRGLLGATTSGDEVAGVLGHEMGHSIAQHPERAMLRQFGVFTRLKMLVDGWSPEMVQRASATPPPLRHSRTNEIEADDITVRILTAAGLSAKPVFDFFERISLSPAASMARDVRLPHFAATHPTNTDRHERIRALSAESESARPALDPGEWHALRSICG